MTQATLEPRAWPREVGTTPQLVARSLLPLPVLLYLFAVVLPVGMQAGPLALTSLRVLLLIFVIPLGIRLLLGHYGRIIATDILFVLFLLWTGLALAVNNPDQAVQQMGSAGVEFIGGYLVGRACIRSREAMVALCRTLALIVLALIPFAIFEAMTGRAIVLEMIRNAGFTTPPINAMEPRLGLERVQLSFAHAIHWGLFCSVTLSFCFVGLNGLMGTARRWITSALIAGSGFLALSSGALLAMVLQFGLIAWAMIFAGYKQRWWLLLGLFALGYVVVDLISNRTALDVFMSYATFNAETAYWRKFIFIYGMDNVWANPFLGIGLNDWVRPDFMWYNSSVDNFWLLNTMRYGIPAFVFLTLGYILVVARVMRRDFSSDTVLSNLRRAWVFTFLGLSFTLCTVHIWTNIYSFVFFLFGAGVWLITAQPKGDDEAAPEPAGPPPASRFTRFPERRRLLVATSDTPI